MFLLLLLTSLATSLVSSFSVHSLTRHGYGSNISNKREAEKWPCNERKKNAVLLHLARPVTGFNDSLSPLKGEEDGDGNIAYFRKRFGLKDDWYTNNTNYSEVDNMDQSVMMFRLKWIKKRLQLNEAQLGKLIQRQPKILTLRPEMNVEPTIQFLQQELALNNTRLPTLIAKQPTILSLGIHKNQTLQRNLNWIKSRLHVNDPKELGKFVVKAPSIINLDVERNLEATFLSLQERLELNETQVARIFVRCPQLLELSYSLSVEPKLEWLENTLHLNQQQLRTMIGRTPKLLTSSLDEGMKPKRRWLKDRLELTDQEVGRLIQKAPSLLGFTVDNLEVKLKWCQDNLFLDNDTDLGQFLLKFPTLLTMSVHANLEPSLEFFKYHLGAVEGSEFVLTRPMVLTMSLERRLRPRMEQIKDMGILIDATYMRRICNYDGPRWLSWLGPELGSQ